MAKDLIPITKVDWKIIPREPKVRALPQVKPRPGGKALDFPVTVTAKMTVREPLPEDVNQVLKNAADHLERNNNWTQGGIGNDDQVCAVGALLRAESGDRDNVYHYNKPYRHPLTSAAVTKLANHIRETVQALPPPSRDPESDRQFDIVSLWNDSPGRTKAEVVSVLRQVASKD